MRERAELGGRGWSGEGEDVVRRERVEWGGRGWSGEERERV